MMTEESAGQLCRLFDEANLGYWVVGGWGVDALLGQCTREHYDLDVFFLASQHAQAFEVLHEAGYQLAHRWEENVDVTIDGEVHPTAYVLEDSSGRQVDVHVLDDSTPVLVPLWSTSRRFISGALDARGRVGGVSVRCMSADMQLVAHQGYQLPETHEADVALLGTMRGSRSAAAEQTG